MGRIRMLLAVVVVLFVAGTALPAHADTRSLEDAVSTVGEPRAPYDLRRVTWNYTDERFVVTSSRLGRYKQDVVLTVRAAHDWEGYVVEARTWWEGTKKFDRLWISYDTLSRTPIDCPGQRSRWRLNLIRVSIPNDCLFDGAAMRDFSAATSTSDTSEVLDETVTARRLTSD